MVTRAIKSATKHEQSDNFIAGVILAGLWGAKNVLKRDLVASLAEQMFKAPPRDYWDFDQALLRRIVWPEAKSDAVVNDAYFCSSKHFCPAGVCRPFPTKRDGLLYTGWGAAKNSRNQTGIKECPEKCRPEEHRDWLMC